MNNSKATMNSAIFDWFWNLYVIGGLGTKPCSLPKAMKLPVIVSDPNITSKSERRHFRVLVQDLGEMVVVFGDADQRRSQARRRRAR